MNIKSQKDFFSGLMFMVLGAAFAWGATKYSIGTGARMGPGYFPLMLGVLLAILGAVVAFNGLVIERVGGGKVGKWAWKPLIYIIGANLIFGVCLGGLPFIGLKSLGLITGIYALTFVASMAEPGWKVKNTFFLATALAVISYLAFIKLLKLQFPVWPVYFTA
ncbi:MAG: tripartite tricarboxylate transporter TctB family protein [Comamonadaceae bacterium]|nr:tripartite tricarboxylate transporter TctB family protein [Comamonadaceae bacterium]